MKKTALIAPISVFMCVFMLASCQPVTDVFSSQPERPIPPFRERQFGDYGIQIDVVDPRLSRAISIYVEPPQDMRSTDYISLDDFWLQPGTLGLRQAQPQQIEEYLLKQLTSIVTGIKGASAARQAEDNYDLHLVCQVHEAHVTHFKMGKNYSCSVEITMNLLTKHGRSLLTKPLEIDMNLEKLIGANSQDPDPIKPLVEQTFEKCFQVFFYNNEVMLALRNAARQ